MLVAVVSNHMPPQRRWPLREHFVLALVPSDVITFAYHYRATTFCSIPRLASNRSGWAPQHAARWAASDLVRVALVLGSWISTLTALLGKASAWPNL